MMIAVSGYAVARSLVAVMGPRYSNTLAISNFVKQTHTYKRDNEKVE